MSTPATVDVDRNAEDSLLLPEAKDWPSIHDVKLEISSPVPDRVGASTRPRIPELPKGIPPYNGPHYPYHYGAYLSLHDLMFQSIPTASSPR